jgi:hypothetical protein
MDSAKIEIIHGPGQSCKALAAERWFGYGRWSAPYWFVGMEPGGEDDARVYETWYELGAPELLDLKTHSEKCEDMRWLVEHPPLQATWKQLIRMALGYEGAPSGTEDVRCYQRDRLGRSDADTLLIELSAVNAPSLSVHVAERESHRADRIATIRRRMDEHTPTFVVFYGVTYRAEYEKVVGAAFNADGYRWHGNTLCALVRHPAARSSSPASWWLAKGYEMRTMRLSHIG